MSPFRRLLTYVTRYRRKFAVGVVTVVASRGGYLLAPAVTGRAIDDLTAGITVDKLVRWGVLLLAIGLFCVAKVLIAARFNQTVREVLIDFLATRTAIIVIAELAAVIIGQRAGTHVQ